MKNFSTIAAVVFVFFPLFAANRQPIDNQNEDKKFIQYLAGIEFLDQKSDLTLKIRAEKYRELCQLTGVNAVSASEFISRFAHAPDQWRKVRADILDLLQTLK
jgi:hypothetical protein